MQKEGRYTDIALEEGLNYHREYDVIYIMF